MNHTLAPARVKYGDQGNHQQARARTKKGVGWHMKGLYKDLEGKNALITGGAGGLGYAIAQAFVANHSNVVMVGRNEEKLRLAKKELGEKASYVAFDLDDIDRMDELIAEITDSTGEIDVLVNNAGINWKKDALAVCNDEFQNIIQTNQNSVFAITREVARQMVARGAGSIIMISSMASQYGIPKVIGYTASKAAVEGMTRALAVEWAPYGIRVNCIAPGFIATAMSSKALDDDPERKKRVLARTPMGRLGEPSDVANAALFLASTQAKYITGIVLPVDGGNSIGF
jgi:NAD(P)-dependent dehydrogenase (short-subunit alcohol dehydrogenase family)